MANQLRRLSGDLLAKAAEGRGPPDCHDEGVAPRVPRPVKIDLFVVAVGSAELKAGQSCRRGNLQSPNACSGLSYSMCPVVGARRIGNSNARCFAKVPPIGQLFYGGGHTPSPWTFPNGPVDPSIHPFSNAKLRSLSYPERAVFMSSWACCNFPYSALQSSPP